MTEQAVNEKTTVEKRSGSFKIVVFSMIANESRRLDYGVRIEQVQEIGVLEQITRVPGAPSFVKGVMNLRGKIVSVIDARQKLGIEATSASAANDNSNRVLVVRLRSNLVGLLVDEVDNVLQILASEVETSPDIISESTPYIIGIARHAGRLIMLLDLEIFIEGDNSSHKSRMAKAGRELQ